jgi:hypothetical protein
VLLEALKAHSGCGEEKGFNVLTTDAGRRGGGFTVAILIAATVSVLVLATGPSKMASSRMADDWCRLQTPVKGRANGSDHSAQQFGSAEHYGNATISGGWGYQVGPSDHYGNATISGGWGYQVGPSDRRGHDTTSGADYPNTYELHEAG